MLHLTSYFDHLELRNAVVDLMMLLALCDAYSLSNGVT